MSASYIFSNEGLVALAQYIDLETLFAFDIDGTLAPIVDDFTAARITNPVKTTLARLATLANVAVITGRSRQDALEILGFEPHLLIGNHGAEWPEGSDIMKDEFIRQSTEWQEQLQHELTGVAGVEIEFKGETLSVHYRKAVDQSDALVRIHAAVESLDPKPKIIRGKFVVNVLPTGAPTKGEALVSAMKKFGARRAVYFGDDVTDEEVFLLKDVDLFGIHIGKDDNTAAAYYLKRQSALLGLLNSIVGMVEQHAKKVNCVIVSKSPLNAEGFA